MPDSRLRAAAYAAGVFSAMMIPVCVIFIHVGWANVLASKPNWYAGAFLIFYVVLVTICTYLVRRGVNLGRGLL